MVTLHRHYTMTTDWVGTLTVESPSSGTMMKDMSISQCQTTLPKNLHNTTITHAESEKIVHWN